MNSTPYRFGRNMRGDLVAKTVMLMLDGTRRELHIETSKRDRGLSCTASVMTRTEDGLGLEHAFGGPLSDFYRTLETTDGRCTEKAVRAMHERCIANADTVLADARSFYAAKQQVAA